MLIVSTYFVLKGLHNGEEGVYAQTIGFGTQQEDGWYWMAGTMEDGKGPFDSRAAAYRDAESSIAQWYEIGRGGIERHLGDVCTGDDSADTIYDEAFVCAHDALLDSTIVPGSVAKDIASELAQNLVQQ